MNEDQFKYERRQVIQKINKKYNGVVDYDILDADEVHLLDRNEMIVAVISKYEFNDYWNAL